MDRPPLQPLPVPPGVGALTLRPALAAALAGDGPALVPYPAGSPAPELPVVDPAGLPDGLALVVGTSGSTGTPKRALLTAPALRASARATHERLGGPGQWLLAMPAHHVAGLQVLVRSVVAGTEPRAVDTSAGFTVDAFAAATASLDAAVPRHYTALVPTQLVRLLQDPRGRAALQRYDAVLLGGAAAPSALLATAEAAGVRVLTTYGMSETAGGCVYDGEPLACSRVRIETDGRILLGGDTLASGYLGRADLTEAVFVHDADGRRWFRTDDEGSPARGRPARRGRARGRRHQHRRGEGGSAPGRGGPAQPRRRRQRGGRRGDAGPGVGRGGRRGGRPRRRSGRPRCG